ncbi:MAG: type II toxin-antitoxin system PemK/MazF family toxin [Anaerolineae bacterium]|nr:type II toxin-antitoxin system PemK/MazF family toxin [Anaerolineae bacterium]
MPSYSKGDIVLVRYPFSDLSGTKVRPAVVVSVPHVSQDLLVVPLTSRTSSLLPGEFLLADWQPAGLNIASAVKRGLYTIQSQLCLKTVGHLTLKDMEQLDHSLKQWLGL